MHAVVVKVTIQDVEAAQPALRERVVPGVSQLPGFAAGYWTRKDNSGLSMVLFDTEENASSAAETVRSAAPEGVQIDDVELREVVAHA